MLLALAVLAGVVALIQRHGARAQALTSDAERIGAQALTDDQVDRSLLLGVASVRLQDRAETRSDLFAALQQNNALIRLIRPSGVEITALRVSPDGRLLAVGDASGMVRFIDLRTWKQSGPAVHLDNAVGERDLTFSPDGKTLMALAIGVARSELYSIDVGRRTAERLGAWNGAAPAAPSGFDSVAYSPDGTHVAVTHDTVPIAGVSIVPSRITLLMVDAATGHVEWQRRYPLAHEQSDVHLAFTRGGVLLTSAWQGKTLLWGPRSGRIVRSFPVGGLPAIAPDGHTIAIGQNSPSSADQSSSVTLLDLRTGRRRTLLATLPTYWIRSLAFTPDGTQLAGAATDGLHVWNISTGKIVESYATDAGPRTLAALDPSGGTLIAGQQDGSIAAYDLAGGRRLGRAFKWNVPSQGCPEIPCMVISRQPRLMATEQADGTVAIVDLRTLRPLRTLPARDGRTVAAMSFMPDARTLVTGGTKRQVTLWDVATGRVTRTLRFADPVWWVAVSPDAKLLAVQTSPAPNSSNRVDVVQVATGKLVRSYNLADGPNGVEFSHDGRELVALGCCWNGSGSTLVAWDTATGRELFHLGGVGAEAFDVAPHSPVLGVGIAGGKFLLLDARSGRRIAPAIQVAGGVISQVSFSPDGHSVAVSSADHTASVWDLQTRSRLGNAFGPYLGTVPSALFAPDGHLVINLLANGVEWPMDVRTWERFACQVAGRNLTRAEWRDVLPNRPYEKVCPRNP
jgi:WD40 repeat protein